MTKCQNTINASAKIRKVYHTHGHLPLSCSRQYMYLEISHVSECTLNLTYVNAFYYVLTLFPPIARLLPRKLFGLLSFQLGVGCLCIDIE